MKVQKFLIHLTYYLLCIVAFIGTLFFATGLIWSAWKSDTNLHYWIVTGAGLAAALTGLGLLHWLKRVSGKIVGDQK